MPRRILILLFGEIGAAIVTVVYPYWGLLLLLFLTFTRPQDDRPNMAALRIPMVLTVSLIIGTAIRLPVRREQVMVALRRFGLMIAFFVVMLFSAAVHWTDESSLRLDEFATVLTVSFLTLVWVDTEPKVNALLMSFLGAGMYLVRVAIQNPSYIAGASAGGGAVERLSLAKKNINFGNANYMAIFMVILMLLALAWLMGTKKAWLRVVLLGAIGSFIYVFLHAQARAASIAFAVGLLLFWALQPNKVVISAIMVVVLILGAFFMPASYLERLQSIGNYEEDASSTKRIELWRTGIRLFLANPVLGVGPENFVYYADSTPHNAYVQVASEMGALALVLYVALLGSALRAAWRARQRASAWRAENGFQHSAATGVICALAAIAIQGFFTGLAHREFVYLFIALAYGLDVLSEKTARDAVQLPAPGAGPATRPEVKSWGRIAPSPPAPSPPAPSAPAPSPLAPSPPAPGRTALSRYGLHGNRH